MSSCIRPIHPCHHLCRIRCTQHSICKCLMRVGVHAHVCCCMHGCDAHASCPMLFCQVYMVRSRIAFSATMLEVMSQVIKQYPSTVGVAVGGILCKSHIASTCTDACWGGDMLYPRIMHDISTHTMHVHVLLSCSPISGNDSSLLGRLCHSRTRFCC